MLTIENFSKRYNNILILEIKHLIFGNGVYWIKGENGSGKTTLFKSIAGILPFDGEILFEDGTSLRKNPIDYRKRISYSEAEPLYPGFLTAKDIIRFTAKVKGVSSAQQEQHTRTFGVEEFYEKPCEAYSSGMMKKLALTLAFLGEPKLIILDEPLITLDENARRVLFALVKESVGKGTTFLLSSHQSMDSTDLEVTGTFTIKNRTIQSE